MEQQVGILRAQLARKTGCNLETIRYYEKVGLLPGPPRSSNGYRVYSPELVQRLQFILRARDLGYAMDEIRSLLSLTDTGAQTCAEVMARTELHLEDVRRRIADLQKIEVTLATTLARCTGDGSVAKIVKLEHAWRRLNGWSDDGFQVAPFPG